MKSSARIGVLAAALAVGVLLPADRSAGQNLADAVVSGASANDEAIRQYVDQHKAGLTGERAMVERSRRALLEPLGRSGVEASGAFRIAYAAQLKPILTPLVGDKRDEIAVNALRIAGESGTKDGLDLLEAGLKDKRAAVRFMAVSGFGAAARSMTRGNRALTDFTFREALDRLNSTMAGETEGHVLLGYAMALDDAMRVPPSASETIRNLAASQLSAAASRLARDRGDLAPRQAFLAHALKALFDQLSNQSVPVPTQGVQSAAGVARDVLNAIDRAVSAGDLSDVRRGELALLATQCERVAQVAMQRAGGRMSKDFKLGDLVLGSKDAEFKSSASAMVNELAGAPLNLRGN